jgi:hypothetical protein
MKAKLHKDGSVTHWSTYSQMWRRAHGISNADLAAMQPEERTRVMRHLQKHANRFAEES